LSVLIVVEEVAVEVEEEEEEAAEDEEEMEEVAAWLDGLVDGEMVLEETVVVEVVGPPTACACIACC
jgi:hypothetical protein